ncbi:MAG: type II toxin-antitoxin system ParD family antitoxin [Opitutales bacterium]|nr:type II toxin-antitoxin system ParD family antitoxin [Opitutales bacterium]
MNVSLTPELEHWVQKKVESGFYGSSSEVIREALRMLHDFESERTNKLQALKADLHVGIEQLHKGKSAIFDKSIVERIKKQGKENIRG